MNERIKELAEQADATVLGTMTGGKQYTFLEHDLEKFAELIVRECMSLCEDVKFQHSQYRKEETDFGMKNIYAEGEATCDLLQNKMKEHFGVEE